MEHITSGKEVRRHGWRLTYIEEVGAKFVNANNLPEWSASRVYDREGTQSQNYFGSTSVYVQNYSPAY